MKTKLATLILTAAATMAMSLSQNALAQAPATPAPAAAAEVLTDVPVITGTMNITYGTRTSLDTSGDLKKGSAAIGAKDSYKMNLVVAQTTEFVGEVTRQPKLFSSILGRTKQDGRLYYNLNLGVMNPKNLAQKKTVGKWVGEVPLDPATGIYDLAGGKANESPMRVAIDAMGTQASFTDPFAGRLAGKAEKKEGLGSAIYTRVIGDKQIKITVKKADPMKFQGIELAKGPTTTYPRASVNGSLDYDYETSNYLTDGITITYAFDGKEYTDKITGSIKWVEDPQYKTNGKGAYEFNLRFNEEKNKPATGEGSVFQPPAGEDAFFAVDNSIPSLTGKIEYVDTFIAGEETVRESKVTYNLVANKLTKQQVVNFAKLWLICVGPTNDD